MLRTSQGQWSWLRTVQRKTWRLGLLARKTQLRKSRIGPVANDGRRNRTGKRGVAPMQPNSNDRRSRMGPLGRTASCGQRSRLTGGVKVTTGGAEAARRNGASAIAAARQPTAMVAMVAVVEGEAMEVGSGGRNSAAAAAATRGGEAGSVIARKNAVVARASAMVAHAGGSTATVPAGRIVVVIGPGLQMTLQRAAPGLGAALEEKTAVMAFVDHAVAIHAQVTEGTVASVQITEAGAVTETR